VHRDRKGSNPILISQSVNSLRTDPLNIEQDRPHTRLADDSCTLSHIAAKMHFEMCVN